ncbi:PaaI family thioesterase, partial [Paraburkholderia sp. BR14262]|uniref:PaaI family thioesterase n=1 Tax=Paraburkholderia sp. BR14262 TaxID=3236999 RepID=UPI0034CFC953
MTGTADQSQGGGAPKSEDAQEPQPSLTIIESPFVEHLGAQLVSARDGASEVVLPLAERHLNTWEVAHGGVTLSRADIALA